MPKTVLADRPLPAFDPANDGRHRLRDLPLERESIPYVLVLPDDGIAAFIYTWVTQDHRAGSTFVAFGPAVGPTPIAEKIDGVLVTPETNFDDWKVGAIHLRQDLKMRCAKLSGSGERIQFEAQFDALHPAYAYGMHPDGCPDYAATNRIEQAGRLRGFFRIDGKEYPFDTTGARDHSWGTRDWETPQHWKWLHAQAGPDLCVHFWEINARGRTDLRGYVFRDGRMAEVSSVEIDFETDDQYRQTKIDALVRDTAGRTSHVKGSFWAHFPLVPNPSTTLWEGALNCTIDDTPGVGWSEFMWPTGYYGHLVAMKKGS